MALAPRGIPSRNCPSHDRDTFLGFGERTPRMSKHTATISVNGGNDRIAALAALYQGEKTDASYLFNTAMAMMGIAVSYVVGAIAFLGNPRDRKSTRLNSSHLGISYAV